MAKSIEIPGVGPVEFPDSMDDKAISAAANKLFKSANKPKETKDYTPTEIEQKMRKDHPEAYANPDAPASLGEALTPSVSSVGSFLKGAVVNPIAGMANAVAHPIDTAMGMVKAQGDTAQKAVEAGKRGDISSAAGYGLGAMMPVVGPMAAGIGEKIGSGSVAEGLGEATSMIAAPEAARRAPAAARAVVDTAKTPGTARIAGGGAGVVAGAGTALAGHPYLGAEIAGLSGGMLKKGLDARKAALSQKVKGITEAVKPKPAPEPTDGAYTATKEEPVASAQAVETPQGKVVSITTETGLEKQAQAAPSMPVQPFDRNAMRQQFPDTFKQSPEFQQGLEAMRARRASVPLGTVEPSAIKPGVETIPFAKETPAPEAFKTKARTERAPKTDALADLLHQHGVSPDQVPFIPKTWWRDISKEMGFELPNDLEATMRETQNKVAAKQKLSSPMANPKARSIAEQLKAEMSQ